LPHLVEHFLENDLLSAVEKMVQKVRGSYATVVLSEDFPDTLVAARKDNR
jgi:glucosamine--fructose-6-phosphate aminotransferase (isomerizing)